MKPQNTLNSQSNSENKEKSWSHHMPYFKLYYTIIVIKIFSELKKDISYQSILVRNTSQKSLVKY